MFFFFLYTLNYEIFVVEREKIKILEDGCFQKFEKH